jgi:predicted neutral ceramidase superfamily lipid hydrolase
MSTPIPTTNRTWISPIAAIAFIAVAVTGIIMLFHVHQASIKNLHEWIGVVFAVAGLLHLMLNWKSLISYFNKRIAIVAAVATLLICIALFVFHGEEQHRGSGPGGEGPGRGGQPQQMQKD